MSGKAMNLTLRIWRQDDAEDSGRFETHEAIDVSPDMSFLEMLDVVNEGIIADGNEPIAFDSDCREGICGTCSMVINGVPHGGQQGTTACQLHMRQFSDSDTITIEPWRATAFPVQRDCRPLILRPHPASGRLHCVRTGSVPDANATPVPKEDSDLAMDAAQCIGCGACVAACKNASAMLFVAAKSRTSVSCHRANRNANAAPCPWCSRWMTKALATAPYRLMRGSLPKGNLLDFITRMNREYGRAILKKSCS